jgi:hypothetical protein
MDLGKSVSDDIFQKIFNDYNSFWNIDLHNTVDNSCYLKLGDIIEEPLDDLAVFISDVSQNNLFEWN